MKFNCTFLLLIFTNFLFAQSYESAESAEYDASQNRWLISNGDNILQREDDGTLSFFGDGSASHGIEVMGENGFAIDGNMIRGFNLDSGEEVMAVQIPGAIFLNGLTNDGVNTLYATDFALNNIYRINTTNLNNPTVETIIDNTFATPNGILYDGDNNRLLWVTWGSNASIRAVDLSDMSLSLVKQTSVTNLDGIDSDAAGNIYVSSWSPAHIIKFDKNFADPLELITTPALNSPADIGYSQETNVLAIPVGDDVIFVQFDPPVSTSEQAIGDFSMTIFPNPVSENSVLQFELKTAQKVVLNLYNMEGKLVANLLNGQQINGVHKIVLAGLNLENGNYFCQLKGEGQEQSFPFVVQK